MHYSKLDWSSFLFFVSLLEQAFPVTSFRTRHSVVVNLWNVCKDGFQREINFLKFSLLDACGKEFPTGFAGDIQKQPLQWGLSGPQLQDARCRMWLFHTHCLAFFLAMFPFFLPCLLFNRNCTLALWLCTLALKMFEAVPRCSAFTGVVSSDSWSSPCLRCAWPQITCLCSTVMSTTGNWHSFFMSHLTHLHLKRNIVQLTVYFHYYCAVDWIVLQIFFKPFCDRGHHPLQLFPSISFHFLAGLTCLMPVSLTPSTALTDILMHLAALGFSSDNPVRHALGHFPLVSCPMWVVRCELARNSARIEIALAVVWAFCGLQICAWLCLGNDWVVF